MALQPTLHRFRAEISDVDRATYASIDLRVARHASETERHLWARMLAYCLFYEEGLALCAEGIAALEDPAAYKRDASGWHVWLEVGTPSVERLHKASKAAGHVVVVGRSLLTSDTDLPLVSPWSRWRHRPYTATRTRSISTPDDRPPLPSVLQQTPLEP